MFIRVYIEDIMKLNPDGVLNIITNFGITDLDWYLYRVESFGLTVVTVGTEVS